MPGTWAHFEGCFASEVRRREKSKLGSEEAEAGLQANVTTAWGETAANRPSCSPTWSRRCWHWSWPRESEEVRTRPQGYSLDAAVMHGGREVAIEVDGPSHFCGRTPTGATALKRRQLRAA